MKLKWFRKKKVEKEVNSADSVLAAQIEQELPETKPLSSRRLRGKKPKTKFEKRLLAVWAGVIAIGLSVGLGALVANYSTYAGAWPRGAGGQWNSRWGETASGWLPSDEKQGVYERVLYFGTNSRSKLAGRLGEYSLNDSLIRTGQQIRYYQAIEEEYAAGLIDYSRENVTRKCSSEIFYPELKTAAQRKRFKLTSWASGDTCTSASYTSAAAKKNPIKHGNQDNDASKEVRDYAGVKNPWNFVDSYYGAQYLGSLYDMREYFYNGIPGKGANYYYKGNRVGIVGAPGDMSSASSQFIREYHFYPGGFLKELDEKYMFTDICTQRTGERTNDTKKDQKIDGATIKPGESYTFNELQCKGVFVERGTYSPNDVFPNDVYDNWALTEEWYEETLRNAEAEVAHLKSNSNGEYTMEKGSFKGVIRLGNMPYSGGQDYGAARGGRGACLHVIRQRSYNILQGGRNVFLTYDTDVRAKTSANGTYPTNGPFMVGRCTPDTAWTSDEPWLSGLPSGKNGGVDNALKKTATYDKKVSNWYKDCWERLKENPNDLCRYTWVSKADNDSPQTLNSSAFITFESSYDAPFTISSTLYTKPTELTHWVAFVLVDDPEEIAEDPILRASLENFETNYKLLHDGLTIYDDPDQQLEDGLFGLDDLIEKGQVVGFYEVSDFSSFDPYSINYLVMGNNETVNGYYQIDWYKSREYLELGVAIQPGQRLDRGYQKRNRIYYGSIKNRTVEFDPTCYSGNDQYWSGALDNDVPSLLEVGL